MNNPLIDISAWLRTATLYLLVLLLILVGIRTCVRRKPPDLFEASQGQMMWQQYQERKDQKGKKAS